jgi:uncharacterized hydrophobic protein (TIGR00271 family)
MQAFRSCEALDTRIPSLGGLLGNSGGTYPKSRPPAPPIGSAIVLGLEIFGESSEMDEIASLLGEMEGVSRIRVLDSTHPRHSVVVASVRPRVADGLLHELRDHGVPEDDIALYRLELVARATHPTTEAAFVWEDVLGMAWVNARPIARYLVFMLVAGVIACYGVLQDNSILIVGAMAVSPDLLPITAVGVAIVGGRWDLAGRAALTLVLGLTVATVAAALLTYAREGTGLLDSGFDINQTILGSLTEVSDETIAVAFAAGVAGMLALETRASSAVGVAISVTTIPVAAYLGVTVGLGEFESVGGAFAVLATNVAMLVAGASAALLIQRRLVRRTIARSPARFRSPGSGG